MVVNEFKKPSETPEQLLTRLEERGLKVPDRSAALACLRFVGGYRLKGFWFHLIDRRTKTFPLGTTFDNIFQRYEFDRQLRKMTFDEVGRIEIALRCAISNHLSLKHGPHWFLEHKVFRRTKEWSFAAMVRTIDEAVARTKVSPFIEDYLDRYDVPCLPPSWAISECVTFGFWSRTYQIIKDADERKAISMKFSVENTEVFESWLHCLIYVRNMTSHHVRILRGSLVISPQKYKKRGVEFSNPNSFFAAATVVNYLLKNTGMPITWKQDLKNLFLRFPTIDPSEIGFPGNWELSKGW